MNRFNGLVYDLEIERAILGKGQKPLEDIAYCDGWHDHKNMGISVIGAYDCLTGRTRVYMRDNWSDFEALLEEREFLIGFNNIGFDNKVLRAAGLRFSRDIDAWSYDILAEMWRAAGFDPTVFRWQTHGGYGLDATAQLNLGASKTGNGALAPVQWQRGEIGAVVDYCLQDVLLTKELFDRILAHGILLSPKEPSRVLTMRRPDPVLWEAQGAPALPDAEG